jgi:hypothetical protein
MEEEVENILQHHGVEDQRWGVRNGPPYPLSGDNKKAAKAAYKEAKTLKKQAKKAEKQEAKTQAIQKQKNKIIANADTKAMRKHPDWFSIEEIDYITKKRKQLDAGKVSRSKKKALDEADLNEIKKHPEKYTSEDMKYALERRKLLDAQHQKTKSQVQKERDLDDMYAKIQKAAAIASAATTIVSLGKAGMDLAKSYKSYKVTDIDASDKRFQNQFNNLKSIDKNMALDAFNTYWNTDYKLSDLPKEQTNKKDGNDKKNNSSHDKKNNSSHDKKNIKKTSEMEYQKSLSRLKEEYKQEGKTVHDSVFAPREKYRGTLRDSNLVMMSSLSPGYDWYSDWKKRNPGIKLTTRL